MSTTLEPTTLESFGQTADALGVWLSGHAFVVILAVALPLGLIVLFVNIRRDSAQTAGRVLKVVTSAGSMVTALIPLLPLVARASWGATGAISAPPSCIQQLAKTGCAQSITAYSSLFARQSVPYSTLLAVAVLCLFFAALVWLITALRDAFKA